MIPNLSKGKGVTGALAYVMGQGNDKATGERLQLEAGEISRADLLGGQGFGFEIDSAERLELARRIMEWNAKPENQASRGRKCELDCLHASLSWEQGQEPTREEMIDAARDFLKSLGMESAQAVFVAHNDTEHRHLHLIASRIDPETGKTFSQANDYEKAQAWALQWEKQHGLEPTNDARRALHALADAVQAHDTAAILHYLTDRNPTFTARQLDKVLGYASLSREDRAAYRAEVLADENVVGLRETAEAAVSRYTTRDVLADEIGLLRYAQKLADDRSHGVDAERVTETAAAFTLKPEQERALAHLTGEEGFAMLWGEAGTGKSHTLKAVRAAYEAEGRDVRGLSWTNDVVQQMRGDGYGHAATIASQLKALDEGREAWGRDTVLIVDEAAMVSTANLARLGSRAAQAGAKLILAGDDAQLSSIERGGMFETLRQQHGAAVLEDVQRVTDAEQKRAFNQMHNYDFKEALQTFAAKGGVHWSERQAEALPAMAQAYTQAVEADPSKSRFMFAFTNAEVEALNAHARALHRARGDLGEDLSLPTAHGEAAFATGDRIQFTGNGYGKEAKNSGLTNGRVGTIEAIDTTGELARMTVALDVSKGADPQSVSFEVGADGRAGQFDSFKHGYAGTIYRGQGRTLDESFVCHSDLWRGSSAYVALTRHREDVQIFAAHETVSDLDAMARGLSRPDSRRAATAYELANGMTLNELMDVGAAPVEAALGVAERVLDAIAETAEAAIETLADTMASLLGGGSSSAPVQQPDRALTAAEQHEADVRAYLAAEREERAKNLAQIKAKLDMGASLSADESLQLDPNEQQRSRDRGQSL